MIITFEDGKAGGPLDGGGPGGGRLCIIAGGAGNAFPTGRCLLGGGGGGIPF